MSWRRARLTRSGAKPGARAFRLTRPDPSESDRQRAIRQYLLAEPRVGKVIRYNRGVRVIPKDPADPKSKRRWVRFNDAPGHSDLGGHLRPSGRAFYFECKRDGEEPTEDQSRFLNEARANGAVAGVVRCVEDAKALIDAAFSETADQPKPGDGKGRSAHV